MTSEQQLIRMRNGETLSAEEKVGLVTRLSIPTMIAQLAAIIMDYIDSGMVGALGPDATASIGLVMTSLWLVGGINYACIQGYTIQTAIAIGAKEDQKARNLIFEAIVVSVAFGLIISLIGAAIHTRLPYWMGGNTDTTRLLADDASGYFLIYCLFMPIMIFHMLCNGMLSASGNMMIPGILDTLVCLFDVVFNYFCIYETRMITLPWGARMMMPGLGLGVRGAALGTGLAETVIAAMSFYFLMRKKSPLHFRRSEHYYLKKVEIAKALRISVPMAFERIVMNGAQIAYTKIIAPLGVTSIAANSFAVTVECMCYYPGFGVQGAASTLVGQSLGADQKKTAYSFGKITLYYGMILQGLLGVLMAVISPALIGLLTPSESVVELAVRVLRIEAVIEALYGASIVVSGILRGAEDTFIPSIMNFVSVWAVRIPLALIFTNVCHMGLIGVWTAMAIELAFRGTIFIIRFYRKRWLKL